ncbi:hypothetical protein ACTID9_12370 [Brevibacillus fluminis]|uniref:hypothetical protein n=1 Tax=Brevibacillus fluminis TaxID=511487 RepID=UPI003F8C991F
MIKIRRSRFLPCMLLVCMIVYANFHSPLPAKAEPSHNWSQLMDKQVSDWIHELGEKDPAFADWGRAHTTMETLGSGMRQWLVHLTKANRPVGYLVVGEVPGKSDEPHFALLEYGLGEYTLFDPAQAPADDALAVYDGLSSRWEFTGDEKQPQSANAMTGEHYPPGFVDSAAIFTSLQTDDLISEKPILLESKYFQLSSDEIDPFARIDWLTRQESERNYDRTASQLLEKDESERIVLTTSQYDGKVLAPYTVGAVHLWGNNITYVGVWDQGLRFLPAAYVEKVGQFNESE